MKKLSADSQHTKLIAAASAFVWTIAIVTSAGAAQLQEARVTQVVNDVKLLLEQAAPRPAVVSDLVRHGNAVRTGTQSRSELTFADLTITRLGANTIFSFKEGTREMTLTDGAILFQVPKGSGGATIRTVGVTAAITGTTGIGEFHPATTSHPLSSKWLCLEGKIVLHLPNGQSVELGPGQMVTTDGKSFSKVMDFDITRLVTTSLFFTGFDRPLPSLDLIMLAAQNQLTSGLLAINPLDPTRLVDVISQVTVAEQTEVSPPPPPPLSPTPSKFGTPSVITSPVPYLITSGTVITTDPSITTNGVTDFGKIYRGQTDDGAFSLWAFGSTSAVDTALDFDTHFNNAGHFPAAAFKFTSLVLAGNPTIDLSNGGVTNLALISVGDITSGLPGGTLTFTGLDALLLASQDGSINLGSEITFQDIPTLFFYARGTNGDLTLASPIVGTTDLFLYAGRNITFNAGTDLILGGQFSARSAGGNISVSESGNIAIGGSLAATSDVIADAANGGNITFATGGSFSASHVVVETTVEPGVTLTDGANITFDIGTGLTVNSGSLSLTINDSNGGTIGTGGNITLNTGGNLTVNGGGALTLYVLNNDGGHIGTGGNISVTTGGDLTAGSIDALINNRNGGSITSGANLKFDIGGALSTQGDATFVISNRDDGSGGGTIGGNVNLTLGATSISAGGILVTDISTNRGGHIMGSAHNTVDAAALLSAGTLDFEIENAGFDSGSGFAPGGTIDSDAILSVTASDISTTSDYFNEIIANDGGGHIGGNATVNVLVSSMDVATNAFFTILNGQNGEGTPAGTIGGNATINVSATNISTGGALEATIDNSNGGNIGGNALINFDVFGNTSGSIGGNAIVNFGITGDLTTTQGDAVLAISNDTGGTIGSDAVINVTANNISTGGALVEVITNVGGNIVGNAGLNATAGTVTVGTTDLNVGIGNQSGSIGGNASISFNAIGDINQTNGNTFFQILNDQSGDVAASIGNDATVTVSGANILTSDQLFVAVANNGSSIGGNAIIDFTATGDITGNNTFFVIPNVGGSIGGDAVIDVTAANITANSLLTQIDNTGGSIGANTEGGAMINMNVSNTATITNDATFQILGSDGAQSASIDFNGGNYNAGGTFLSFIDGNGTITFNNASAHADVLKAGVFGANGRLNIGGGTLSADTTLKLYAPGSNGELNFISNVTLGGNSVKILAANTITILDDVVVTIGGSKPANVYTGFTDETPNANYTGFGGNGSTSGTFAGAGANKPQPIGKAPPFGTTNRVTSSGKRDGGGKATNTTINVNSSDELLAMLDDVHPGRDGRIRILDSKRASHGRNASRLNAAAYLNAHRQAMDKRTASTPTKTRLPQ